MKAQNTENDSKITFHPLSKWYPKSEEELIQDYVDHIKKEKLISSENENGALNQEKVD